MDAQAWDERYRSADLVWGSEPNRFIRQQCQQLPVGAALDLACGEGRNAIWLARLGWQVTGLDYSAVAVERASQLAEREGPLVSGRLAFQVADVTRPLLDTPGVDLVLVSYVHLPTEQHNTLMHTAAQVVKPGGHLVVVGHDRRNLVEGVGGPQDADLLYVPAELERRLAAEGLVVELAETVQRPTPNGVALDSLVRSRRPGSS